MMIFGAICTNGMTAPESWVPRTAPHRSEAQRCCVLGNMHSMTGYTFILGIVSGLRALYLIVEYSPHTVQMVDLS